jgi:hypothetical protein
VNARRIATGMAASATLAIVAVMGLARHQTATAPTNVVTSGGSTDVGQPVATVPPTDGGWQSDDGWQADDGWQTDDGQPAVTLPQAQPTPTVSVAPPTIRQRTTPIVSTHGSR